MIIGIVTINTRLVKKCNEVQTNECCHYKGSKKKSSLLTVLITRLSVLNEFDSSPSKFKYLGCRVSLIKSIYNEDHISME